MVVSKDLHTPEVMLAVRCVCMIWCGVRKDTHTHTYTYRRLSVKLRKEGWEKEKEEVIRKVRRCWCIEVLTPIHEDLYLYDI